MKKLFVLFRGGGDDGSDLDEPDDATDHDDYGEDSDADSPSTDSGS